jgi:hypothetical protein
LNAMPPRPKRKTHKESPPEALMRPPAFSDIDFEELISATESQVAPNCDLSTARTQLEQARQKFLIGRGNLAQRPNPSEQIIYLELIASNAHDSQNRGELVNDIPWYLHLELSLELSRQGERTPSGPSTDVDQILERALRGDTGACEHLADLALGAARTVAVRKASYPKRRRADETLVALLDELAPIYMAIFSRQPTVTINSYGDSGKEGGRREGPFVRFVHAFVSVSCRADSSGRIEQASTDALAIRALSEDEIGGGIQGWRARSRKKIRDDR